jgi:hypothetical protein
VLLMSLPLMAVGPSPARRAVLTRRVRWFGAATITYNVNVIKSIIAITDGTMASSTALIGFGLDTSSRYRRPPRVAGQFAGPDHERRDSPPCGSSRCRSSPSPPTSA